LWGFSPVSSCQNPKWVGGGDPAYSAYIDGYLDGYLDAYIDGYIVGYIGSAGHAHSIVAKPRPDPARKETS
jgi:hypothetical protein